MTTDQSTRNLRTKEPCPAWHILGIAAELPRREKQNDENIDESLEEITQDGLPKIVCIYG